jgi:SMC interacting uncharacterized protein involved in chromosome segregation
MYKTFEELERFAYMSNLPKIAKLYAQLDDNERDEYEIERLKSKIDDLEFQCNKQKVTLEKIAEIINE